jgi:hypothetical protein
MSISGAAPLETENPGACGNLLDPAAVSGYHTALMIGVMSSELGLKSSKFKVQG